MTPILKKQNVVRIISLLIFIVIVISVFLFDIPMFIKTAPVKDYMGLFGIWKIPIFILATATAILLFIPATIMILMGGVLFGAVKGFFVSLLGCLIGATCSFMFARTIGREFVKSRLSERLQKYDNALNKHAFRTVVYLRLLQVPFVLLNFSLGLTGVKFKDFFYGTALGASFSIFILVFMGEFLVKIVSGGLSSLPLKEVFLNILILVSMFAFLVFAPLVMKKINSFINIKHSDIG